MKREMRDLLHVGIGVLAACALMCTVAWRGVLSKGTQNSAGGGYGYAAASISVCCSSDGGTIIAADLDGVYRSLDGGATWATITPRPQSQ
jgi:hypothetical protein